MSLDLVIAELVMIMTSRGIAPSDAKQIAWDMVSSARDHRVERKSHRATEARTLTLPVRLRDLRRAVSRDGAYRSHPLYHLARVWAGALGIDPRFPHIMRDLDRAISRLGPDYDVWPEIAAIAEAVEIDPRDAAGVDRIIEERPEAERTEHKTGSDEVSDGPHTNPDADTHGGDGNSGEIDHPSETAADNRQGGQQAATPNPGEDGDAGEGEGQGGEDGLGQGGGPIGIGSQPEGATGSAGATSMEGHDDALSTPDQPSQGRGAAGDSQEAQQTARQDADDRKASGTTPTAGGRCGRDERSEEMGASLSDPSGTTDSKSGDRPAPCPAQGSDQEGREVSCDEGADGEDEDAGALAEPQPVSNASQSGGAHAGPIAWDPDEIKDFAARHRRATRRVVRELRRIIEAACSPTGSASHRWDGRALIRELTSRRYRIDLARRREREIQDLVIAVDESGSCAETVAATYHAAIEAAKALPAGRVSVILHSNGRALREGEIIAPWVRRLLKKHERGLAAHYYSTTQEEASRAVWDGIVARRPGLILGMGDADTLDLYDELYDAGAKILALSRCEYEARHTVLAPVTDVFSAGRVLAGYQP